MDMITLTCVVLDDHNEPRSDIFDVEVSPNITIHELKQKILEKGLTYLKASTPTALSLWKPNDNLEPKTLPEMVHSWRINHKMLTEETKNATYLFPSSTVQTEFHLPLPSHCIHVVVTRRTNENVPGMRKRIDPDETLLVTERWRSKYAKTGLPTLTELASIAERPLEEEEKIPLLESWMKLLISHPFEVHDVCTANDVAVLFRYSEDGTGPLSKFYFSVESPPPPSGTENNYHSFWDINIRSLLEVAFPDGKTQRHSNQKTATRILRPNYGFLLSNFCPFRGEERAHGSTDDPKPDLAEKLEWVYDPAPYVLGYYAMGPQFTLVAITPPPPGAIRPVVYDIAHADLRYRKQRILSLRRIINLIGIIQGLAGIVRLPDPEFDPLERDNCTIEIVSRAVIKTYKDRWKVAQLQYIYALLKGMNVPNTDWPLLFDEKRIILSPRGIANLPGTEKELLEALECVLEMLQVIHASSLFHRDIRWPNVIKHLDYHNKWFVIDWEDAEKSPTHAQPRFSPETHSPRIFVDGHGAEVDIWGVGGLILQCKSLNVSAELQDLGIWMQEMPAPSAQEALNKVRQYQSTHQ